MSNLKSTIKFEDLKKLLISALQEFYDNDAILFMNISSQMRSESAKIEQASRR